MENVKLSDGENKENQAFSLEAGFSELEDIIHAMEKDDISLEKSMELYKRGITVLNKCNQVIDLTEKEIIILRGDTVDE